MESDSTTWRLPAATRPGPVHLRARDADALAEWYADALGLAARAEGDAIELWAHEPVLVLHRAPDASPRAPRESGLYHVALLQRDRPALARSSST